MNQKVNLKLKAKIVEIFGSQADFAQALKIGEPVVSRVIGGRRMLPATEQKRWAKKLGCSVEEIFFTHPVEAE